MIEKGVRSNGKDRDSDGKGGEIKIIVRYRKKR